MPSATLMGADGFAAYFRTYTVSDGLSDNSVLCGIRDKYGFVWIGTANGLNCFDGKNNSIFRDIPDRQSYYGNNRVVSLMESGDDIIVGCNDGLYIYHREKNSFSRFRKKTRYNVIVSTTVQKLLHTRSGTVWICTMGQGFFVYNPQNGKLAQNSRNGGFVTDVCLCPGSKVAITTLNGKVCIFEENGRFVRSYNIPGYVNEKNKLSICYNNGYIWVGTDRGLYRLNPLNGRFETFTPPSRFGNVNTIMGWGKDAVILGTNNGIYTFGIYDNSFRRFDGPGKVSGLPDISINDMKTDREGNLWVMTSAGGISWLPRHTGMTEFIRLPDIAKESRSYVNTMLSMPDGQTLIGTTTGLYRYDPTLHSVTRFGSTEPGLSVSALLLDGHDLWIGTSHNGIRVMNLLTGKQKEYLYSENIPYTLTSNEIRRIYRARSGDIYVATSWGLCRFDRKHERFMGFARLNAMTEFTDICEDNDGGLWAATSSRGAYWLDMKTGEWTNFAYSRMRPGSITSNTISGLFRDHTGRIWIATRGGGLCCYEREKNTFARYAPSEDNIYFIEEDGNERLWIGTENGLLCIAKENHTVSLIMSPSDLWQGKIAQNAVVRTANGLMLIGSEDGFYSLRPDRMTLGRKHEPVYVSKISLPYVSDSDSEISTLGLDCPPYITRKVELPYRDNSFTLHFAAPRFSSSGDVRYEYMLKGVDKDWVKESNSGGATYTNVQPGHYRFLLREAGSNQPPSVIEINVLPPWYRTYAAYIVYLFIICAALYFGIEYAKSVVRKRYNERIGHIKAEQEKTMFESKIRFFVNLMHEIRTPLSLISLPLEQLEQHHNPESNGKYMGMIRHNLDYLLGVINQLLDFQKAESGTKKIEKANCSMRQLMQDVYDRFESYVDIAHKKVELSVPEHDIVTAIDRDCIEKILMNLMSNALKYARTNIVLSMKTVGDNSVCLSVTDDGPGIPDEEKTKIFASYYQVGGDKIASMLGTGLGLAYAKTLAEANSASLSVTDTEGGGSSFNLTLPIETVNAPKTEDKPASGTMMITDNDVSPSDSSTKDFCILIVEDNTDLLNMMRDTLRQWFRVLKATNGVEALNVLAGENADVIVSDVMMPVMDGIELCRKVKSEINYSHIPVILLTAKTSVEAKVEGMESGADVYLEKPFSIRQLHLQIMSLLRMRQNFHKRMSQIDGKLDTVKPSEYGITRQNLEFVENVQKILGDNIKDEAFSIDSMAEQMNMSRSSFYRKLKSLTGMSPVDFLKTQRMNKASRLLLDGLNVSEVAVKVGFSSASYFTKCFKQQFGILPREYVIKELEKVTGEQNK